MDGGNLWIYLNKNFWIFYRYFFIFSLDILFKYIVNNVYIFIKMLIGVIDVVFGVGVVGVFINLENMWNKL